MVLSAQELFAIEKWLALAWETRRSRRGAEAGVCLGFLAFLVSHLSNCA